MKNIHKWICTHKKFVICVVLAVSLFILHHNLYSIALRANGLVETLQPSSFSNWTESPWTGRRREEFRVIFSDTNGGEFATLRRNAFGIWRVISRSIPADDNGVVTFFWTYGFPGAYTSGVNYAYFVSGLDLHNLHEHIASGTGWQLSEPRDPYQLIVNVHHWDGANYILHFRTHNSLAFSGRGTVQDMVQLAIPHLIQHVEMVTPPRYLLHFEEEYWDNVTEDDYQPTTTMVVINRCPTPFRTYEVDGKIYFSISDIQQALQKTQARFFHYNDAHLVFDFRIINDKTYATLADILSLSHCPATLTQIRDALISIDTNEPYISDYHRHIIEEFLFTYYKHIFTRECIIIPFINEWDDHVLEMSAFEFHLFDSYNGIPAIGVRYSPPGSGAGTLVYMYNGGEYNYVGFMPLLDEGGNQLLLRALVVLTYEVNDAINSRIWQMTPLPCGTLVDENICDNIVDAVFEFFVNKSTNEWREWASDLVVVDIRHSLIANNIIRVKTLHNIDFDNFHWLQLCNISGKWKIAGYTTNHFLWSKDFDL